MHQELFLEQMRSLRMIGMERRGTNNTEGLGPPGHCCVGSALGCRKGASRTGLLGGKGAVSTGLLRGEGIGLQSKKRTLFFSIKKLFFREKKKNLFHLFRFIQSI